LPKIPQGDLLDESFWKELVCHTKNMATCNLLIFLWIDDRLSHMVRLQVRQEVMVRQTDATAMLKHLNDFQGCTVAAVAWCPV
jgi:hypothetical protein